jgi:SecD/SecF fusion protein
MLDYCLSSGSNLLAQTTPQFWQQGWFILLAVLGAIALSLWLGHSVSKSLRVPEQSTRLTLTIGSILLSLLIVTYGKLKYGVDLRGGVTFIGQVDLPKDSTFQIEEIIPKLMQRVDPSGTREIMIRNLSRDKIEVTIPDVDMAEADNIWNRLVRTGHLEFRIVASAESHGADIKRAEDKLKAGDVGQNVSITDESGNEKIVAKWYAVARVEPELGQKFDPHAPFKFVPSPTHLVRDKETGTLINMSEVPFSRVEDRYGVEFAAYCKERGFRNVQVLLIEPTTEDLDVQGTHLTDASPSTDEMGRRCVSFRLNSVGSSRMGALTTKNRPNGESYKQLAIVLDDQLHSAPRIESPIHRNGQITGSFTEREITDLCVNLNSGKIEVALNKSPISKDYVKSTLGEELKNQGIWAAGISMVIVLIFMLIYYKSFAGSVSCFALIMNLLLTMAFVIAIKQPLTLTGIAGLVLTIGMAVDANVLIFERIREELAKGSSLRMAINNGFDKATVTIVDSNLTTIITALVLYVIGTEQLKGFAVTLTMGILFSMFTAVYVSRGIFEIAERRKWITGVNMLKLFPDLKFDFLSKAGVAITGSVILIVAGLAGVWMLGSRILDIDLKGGSTARLVFNDPTTKNEVEAQLEAQNLVVNNEKIVFIVSEMDDVEFQDRLFKVDSNLPSPDASRKETWEPLDKILEKTFQNKLRLNKVEYDPASVKTEELDTKTGRWTPAHDLMRQQLEMGFAAAMPTSLLTNMLVSEGRQEQQPADDKKQDAEKQTPAASGDTKGTGSEKSADQKSESPANPSTIQDPNAQNIQLPDTDSGPTVINTKKYRSQAKLNFVNPITPKSLKSFLVEYAQQIDIPVEEDQIRVTNDDKEEVDSPSKSWNVTIESRGETDAQKILAKFKAEYDQQVYFPASSGVGGQIAGYAQLQALVAIVVSFLGIILYVWFRFQSLAFGFAAVLALVHDVLVTVGAIAISNYVAQYFGFLLIDDFKISLTVLAAILTVIGYSLNDTIVIFDRVREYRGKRRELTAEMINTSILQTLSRTILTSLTTFIVVLILYIAGGDSIHAFAFALVVGIIAGTYSTIFIASPALLWFRHLLGDDATLEGNQASS